MMKCNMATSVLAHDELEGCSHTEERPVRLPSAETTASMMNHRPMSSKSMSLGVSMMSTVLLNARLWCGVVRPCGLQAFRMTDRI